MSTIYRCDLCGSTVRNIVDIEAMHLGNSNTKCQWQGDVCKRCRNRLSRAKAKAEISEMQTIKDENKEPKKADDIIARYERDNMKMRIELASLTEVNGDTGIEDLGLSIRSYNCLKRARVNTVGQLESLSSNDLLNIRNLGDKQIDEISEKMVEIGHKLKEVDDD